MTNIINNWNTSGTQYVQDYSNYKFSTNDILWISDTFHLDSQQQLIQHTTQPKYIVNDHFSFIENPNFFVHTIPFYLAVTEEVFFQNSPAIDAINPSNDSIFNFIVNKKQINRYLLIKLVEYFKMQSFDYTWSGIGATFDMTHIIQEWNDYNLVSKFSPELLSFILSPIKIPEKFVHFNTPSDKTFAIVNYGSNVYTWENIFRNLMGKTAVALISESASYEKSAVFTEKTLYALLALNFPIYIGCYRNAEHLEKIGFDVFSDIIDHSYQYYDSLFERCYYAFYNNLKLLSDINYANQLREQNYHRLVNNRNLLFDGILKAHTDATVNSWPEDLRQAIIPIWNIERQRYLHRILG